MDKHKDLIHACSCSALTHIVRFSLDLDYRQVCVHVALADDVPFFHRLKAAIKYVFGRTCNYGYASEVLLEIEQQEELRDWLLKAIDMFHEANDITAKKDNT